MQKSFIIEQFSIGRSTLYYILKNEEKFKAKNEKLSFYYLLLIEYYTAVILFYEKILFVLIWKNLYPDMFNENFAKHVWISA